MRILVTKDASTKIPRDVLDLAEARQIAALGFSVDLLNEDGSTEPLPGEVEQGSAVVGPQAVAEVEPQAAAEAPEAAPKKAAAKRR